MFEGALPVHGLTKSLCRYTGLAAGAYEPTSTAGITSREASERGFTPLSLSTSYSPLPNPHPAFHNLCQFQRLHGPQEAMNKMQFFVGIGIAFAPYNAMRVMIRKIYRYNTLQTKEF